MKRCMLLLLFSPMSMLFSADGTAAAPHAYSALRQKQLDNQLLAAIRRNNVSAVTSLLHQGANPNARSQTNDGETLLRPHPPTKRQSRPPKTKTALTIAFEHRDPATESPNIVICTKLLQHGAVFAKRPGYYMRIYKGRFHHGKRSSYVDLTLCPTGTDWGEDQVTLLGLEQQIDALVEAACKAGARRN